MSSSPQLTLFPSDPNTSPVMVEYCPFARLNKAKGTRKEKEIEKDKEKESTKEKEIEKDKEKEREPDPLRGSDSPTARPDRKEREKESRREEEREKTKELEKISAAPKKLSPYQLAVEEVSQLLRAKPNAPPLSQRDYYALAARLIKRARKFSGEKNTTHFPIALDFLRHEIASWSRLPAPQLPSNYKTILRYWQTWLTGNSDPNTTPELEFRFRIWMTEIYLQSARKKQKNSELHLLIKNAIKTKEALSSQQSQQSALNTQQSISLTTDR